MLAESPFAKEPLLLDRVLANYGPESKTSRELLHHAVASAIDVIFAEEGARLATLAVDERLAEMDQFQTALRELAPQSNAQYAL